MTEGSNRNPRAEGMTALVGLAMMVLLVPAYFVESDWVGIPLVIVGVLGFLVFIVGFIAWFDTALGGEDDGWGP